MPERRDRISSTSGTDYILCPYFRGHNAKRICCVGPIDKSNYSIDFQRSGDKTQHQHIFCEGRYKCCEIYMMNEKMLGDDD